MSQPVLFGRELALNFVPQKVHVKPSPDSSGTIYTVLTCVTCGASDGSYDRPGVTEGGEWHNWAPPKSWCGYLVCHTCWVEAGKA